MASMKKQKDEEMAKYMKAHPSRFPDSVMRPWQGCGADDRARARSMGSIQNNTSRWQVAMMGGVLASRLGLGSYGIPSDFVPGRAQAAE